MREGIKINGGDLRTKMEKIMSCSTTFSYFGSLYNLLGFITSRNYANSSTFNIVV